MEYNENSKFKRILSQILSSASTSKIFLLPEELDHAKQEELYLESKLGTEILE